MNPPFSKWRARKAFRVIGRPLLTLCLITGFAASSYADSAQHSLPAIKSAAFSSDTLLELVCNGGIAQMLIELPGFQASLSSSLFDVSDLLAYFSVQLNGQNATCANLGASLGINIPNFESQLLACYQGIFSGFNVNLDFGAISCDYSQFQLPQFDFQALGSQFQMCLQVLNPGFDFGVLNLFEMLGQFQLCLEPPKLDLNIFDITAKLQAVVSKLQNLNLAIGLSPEQIGAIGQVYGICQDFALNPSKYKTKSTPCRKRGARRCR